jgi:phage baseplate assembly protein W
MPHTTDVDIPHFAYPFRLDAQGVRVTEQDSLDEIFDCAVTTLLTTIGERTELPEFGRHDQAFRQNGADLEELRNVLARWEPRAIIDIAHDPRLLGELLDIVRITVKGA